MFRRILATIISAILIMGLCIISVSAESLLPNGGFEELTGDKPTGWTFFNATYGKEITIDSENVHSGKNSLKTVRGTKPIIAHTALTTGIKGATKCTMGVWADIKDSGTAISFKIEFHKSSFSDASLISEDRVAFDTKEGWQEAKKTYDVPEGTKMIAIYLCNYAKEGVTVYFDDITLEVVGGAPAETSSVKPVIGNGEASKPDYELKTPMAGTGELLKNGDFETVNSTADGAEDWFPIGGWIGNQKVQHSSSGALNGKMGLHVLESASTTWIRQDVHNIIPRAAYQAKVWANLDNMSTGATAAIRLECYNDNVMDSSTYIRTIGSDIRRGSGAGWSQMVLNFIAPHNCRMITMYLKCESGEAFFDDASLIQTGPAELFSMNTDWKFYYSDIEKGTITADVNTVQYPELKNGKAVFKIVDKENVLDERVCAIGENGIISSDFFVSVMTEKKKEYKAEVTIFDASGKEVDKKSTDIYKYDRPLYLTKDGQYLENGKSIGPVITMGIGSTDLYPAVASIGTTAATAYSATTIEQLDMIQKEGMKAFIVLYGGFDARGKFLTAGHPERIEHTKEKVAELMNHPAVFAWGIMDEPFAHYTYPEKYLTAAYRAIRDIDDKHPICLVEINRDKYCEAVKYCDIFTPDIYPANAQSKLGFFDERTQFAVSQSGGKPVSITLQAFKYLGYMPDYDDARNMIYTNFFYGGKGYALYCFSNSQDGNNLDKTEFGNALKEFYAKEQADTFEHFVNGTYPLFNEYKTDDYWYRSYVKDGKIRTIVLNRKDTDEVTAEIKLTSVDGAINVNGFTASVYAGGDVNHVNSDSNSFTVKLRGSQAVVYEITPNIAIDFSGLPSSKYYDMYDYPWARLQAEALREKGIVNSINPMSYGPSINITRGDFAMYFVRTLGLTAETTENFVDVDIRANYAKEIAVGKALGILNGVGENKFNPEAEISRQDLMTIVARGMNIISSAADLSSYTDSSLISDYAKAGVSGMIATGLIKGNANGTINPLGNTTRAEAAVIMYRILEKQK